MNDWIIEGSSVSILKIMKERVDRVVILNFSPLGNITRILQRFIKQIFFGEKRIGWSAKDMNGLRLEFLVNTMRWRTRQLPRIRTNIEYLALDDRVLEFNKSPKKVFEMVCREIDNHH